jgi:enoyl-CoA hydratase
MDLILERKGPVCLMTINRENSYNALNSTVLEELAEAVDRIEADKDVLVAIITGAGRKAFVAGADVKEIKEAGETRPRLIGRGQEILSKIRQCSKVVIAAINGYALGGGCELAMACDIRIASEDATFGLPEVKLGLMTGYGGSQLLPRLIGTGRAKYVMFTGDRFTAREAYELGLVEKLCPPDNLMEEAMAVAKRIASNGPLAVQSCKKAIDDGIALPLDKALKLELEIYGQVTRSEDAETGLTAFLEKKKPVFKGR